MVLEEDFPMIEVSIPSMKKEVDESGKTKKVKTQSEFPSQFEAENT